MDLGLSDYRIVGQQVDHSVGLQLTNGSFIRIESPFTMTAPEGEVRLSPETDPSEHLEGVLQRLCGLAIKRASADSDGTLVVLFDGDRRLSVEPDAAYEAWTVTRADGMMVVCMPGGTLAVWDAES